MFLWFGISPPSLCLFFMVLPKHMSKQTCFGLGVRDLSRSFFFSGVNAVDTGFLMQGYTVAQNF